VFCEKDKYCQRVLRKHWPDVPIVSDIGEFDGAAYPGAFILTGGFPCQPFSVAGKRGGKTDDRYLWPAMLKVIAATRPRWVLAENVPGIIKMELDTVLSDLEAEGYATGTFIIPACAVAAPHRRDRVWIVAHSNISRDSQSGFFNTSVSTEPSQDVADSQRKRLEMRESIRSHNDQEQPTIERSCCQWKPESEWFAESGMGRVSNGIPHRVDRIRALGNAIVPQIAYEIIKTILQVERGQND